jgi:uncharacterized protein (DUF342 family)
MAAIIAKGSADISINPQETEAKLVFVPGDDGMGWDVLAVNKLAGEKSLSPLPSPAVLEPFLQKASRAKTKDPMELLICQGIPPEEPVPETITWEDLPIPDDIAPYREEALSKAEAPELYRIKVEKIKNEKKVLKPGALPFMPGKEEILVTWDKKETREKVTVDPQPKEIKYAGKGKKLGAAVPPKPGKPGKSVFGKPLQPGAPEDGSFLLGAGIIRDKGSLIAGAPGFIRVGGNWADLVPFAKPSWEIKTGADGLTRFFNFEPGDARFALPTSEEIFAEAKARGAAEDTFIDAASLDKAIAEAAGNGTPLEAFPLVEAKEAAARVDINEDKTRAVLYLRKGTAGYQPLEMKAISLAIKDSKVQGFDAEKLKAGINAFMQGNDVELKDYVLAEGMSSTRGKDREVQVLAGLLSGDEMKPVLARLKAWRRPVHEEGVSIDEITGAAFVEKGAKLGEVTSSQEGEAGKDIYGNVIPGLPGNDPELRLFQGIEQHGALISAGRAGLLLIKAADRYFEAEIIDCRDAKIAVRVSEDAMEAKANFVPEAGAGVPLTPGNALKILAAQGIKKGMDAGTIEKACALAKARGGIAGITVARGEPPVAKGACAAKWLVPVRPPQISGEDGGGEKSGRTAQVLAGAVLVEFSAPIAEGRPGFDVKGNDIPVDKGTSYIVEHDDSVKEEILPNRGKRLIAVRPGECSFDGKALKVSSLREIKGDVGPATGNIKFSGELRVSGKVLPGFAVIGGLNVIIAGTAEMALVSAGAKAVILGGIRGGGKGVVRARSCIEAAFSEKATLMAVGGVTLKNGAVLSFIKTNGKFTIEAENGKLLGGVCQARDGIDAANIGAENGGRTEISFGQDYLLKDQIGAVEEEINKVKVELAKIEERIKALLKVPEGLAKARTEKVKLLKLLEQYNLKVFTLREKFEEHYNSLITVRGSVYPGVVIESHDRYYEVHQTRSRVVFYFDRESGRIKERPLE